MTAPSLLPHSASQSAGRGVPLPPHSPRSQDARPRRGEGQEDEEGRKGLHPRGQISALDCRAAADTLTGTSTKARSHCDAATPALGWVLKAFHK